MNNRKPTLPSDLLRIRDDFIVTDHMGSPIPRSEVIAIALHVLSAYADITPGQLEQIDRDFLVKYGMFEQSGKRDLS